MRKIIKYSFGFCLLFAILAVFGSQLVQAADKPKAREDKVIIYTDADPYVFHFINLEDNAKIKFKSSNKSVIKIKNSKAYPVKQGKAKVTATIKQNGKEYSVKISFTVMKPEKQKAKDYDKLTSEMLKRLKKDAIKKTNGIAIDQSELMSTKEDLDRFVYDSSLQYSKFYLYVTDLSIVRSEEEYMDMFPFIGKLEFSELTYYNNCTMIVVNKEIKVSWMHKDERAVDTALTGGDTSYLTKDELKLYKKVLKIAKKLKKSSVYETVKAIHDFIIDNAAYEYDDSNENRYDLSEALGDGNVRCSGYAKAFYFLCKANGINCLLVDGYLTEDSDSNSDGYHAWNLVEINHKWYNVDVTFDDSYENKPGLEVPTYNYFLVTDEDMSRDRVWDEEKYPKAVSKDLGPVYSELEEYHHVTGSEEAKEYLKVVVKRFKDSNDKEYILKIYETTASDEAFKTINYYLNDNVYWKDWDSKKMSAGGRRYRITLYKK